MIDTQLEKIKQISPQEFTEEKVIRQVDSLAEIYLRQIYIGEAKELLLHLSQVLKETNLADKDLKAYERYQNIITKLSWVCVAFLSLSEIELLFKTKLIEAINLEVDLVEKFKGIFDLYFGDFATQDNRRFTVLKALKSNEEKIGSQEIEIEEDNEKVQPMIKNWLKDYDLSAPMEQRRERISLLEYMNTSKNIRHLTQKEKNILRQILEFYDYLRFLPDKVSLKETGHQLPSSPLILKQEPLSPKVGSVGEVEQEILKAYQGDIKQQQAILREQVKTDKKFQGNSDKLYELFYKAVQAKNINSTIAILRLMAQSDNIGKFLKADQKLNQFLSLTWEKQYGKEVAQEFASNPDQLKFIKLFLQYVLQQRLNLSTNEAARVGLNIGNMFVRAGKKEYNKLAYFDVKSKQFHWFED